MTRDDAALVALLRTRPKNLTWRAITEEVLQSGSAQSVWDRLIPTPLISLSEESDPIELAQRDIHAWEHDGFQFLSVVARDFPERLRDIHQVPPFLFAHGELRTKDKGVSIVGSRRASEEGLRIARQIAARVVSIGLTVIAGLADGIDAAAHAQALTLGGRTVAFIGTGIRKSYPAKHAMLQQHVASQGLVLSQFWPDAPAQKQNFLMRNALMSGYGLATIVVEAGEQSGSRAQARMAVEHGRPVILTNRVASSTEWGKELKGKSGVYVVAGIDEVEELILALSAEADARNFHREPMAFA